MPSYVQCVMTFFDVFDSHLDLELSNDENNCLRMLEILWWIISFLYFTFLWYNLSKIQMKHKNLLKYDIDVCTFTKRNNILWRKTWQYKIHQMHVQPLWSRRQKHRSEKQLNKKIYIPWDGFEILLCFINVRIQRRCLK